MQNKLVENWLINTAELSFTTPFVQLLITEGYVILRGQGGQMEQGKDVIAIAPDGEICCFQLKCGNINATEWIKINGQINDLTQIPPVHSSLKSNPTKWRCYLVTNGTIPGSVQRTIVDYSAAQESKGHMSVETIDRDQLVTRFNRGYGNFFPTDTNDLNSFLKMYCEHGDNTLNRENFKIYFEKWLGSYSSAKSKQKKLEALQAAGIIASYLLTNKYARKNYTELINAWILVLLTVLYFAAKWEIAEKHIKLIETTLLNEIDQIYEHLLQDVINEDNHFVDATYGLLSEPLTTHRLRCTELLGYISAYVNYCAMRNIMPKVNQNVGLKISELAKHKAIVGESSTPLLYNYIAFLIGAKQLPAAAIEVTGLLNGLLSGYADEGIGIPSPYYTLQQSAEWSWSLAEEEITESFQNRAYCLWPAVLLAAGCGQRPLLEHHWLLISYISNQEVVPDDADDLLLWRIGDSGKLLDTFPDATQSWEKLVKQSIQNMDEFLPSVLKSRKYLVPLWINVMPHRCTYKTVLSMVNL